MKRDYIISVPYDHDPLDIGAAARRIGLAVKRPGPVRRTQIEADDLDVTKLRKVLPNYVLIEPIERYGATHAHA